MLNRKKRREKEKEKEKEKKTRGENCIKIHPDTNCTTWDNFHVYFYQIEI